MGMSISEFRTAMEEFNAKKESLITSSIPQVTVPCCNEKEGKITFSHSGTYYVVQEGKLPKGILDKAMEEVGEKYPGGDNFWYGEIHSVRGLLILMAMIEKIYSKGLVDELVNATYKKLLSNSLIRKQAKVSSYNFHSSKMEELYKLVLEYNNVVNPFGNGKLKMKDPISYMDEVAVSVAIRDANSECPCQVYLKNQECQCEFRRFSNGWGYYSGCKAQLGRKNSYIDMGHYIQIDPRTNGKEEVIFLSITADKEFESDIDLRISLKTGLAWKTYNEEKAKPASNKQIDVMITYLRKSIKKLKKKILRYMIAQDQ